MSLNRAPKRGIVARSFISGSRFGATIEKALYAAELCTDVYFRFLAFLVAAGTLALFYIVRPRNPFKTKLMPYECGITPFDSARGRYTVRFYIVAILFVVFDVETIFLFPWAVQFKLLGLFGLLEMLIFLGILIVGYIWIWKKGALEWV